MKNNSTEYNKIRRLIEQWYEGTTTRDDEDKIRRFFADTAPEQLPDDLRQEAAIFNTLSDITAEYPDNDLLAEIDEAIAREQQSAKPRRRMGLRLTAGIAAAAVIILLIVGINPGSDRNLATSSEMNGILADNNVVEPVDSAVSSDQSGSGNKSLNNSMNETPDSNHGLLTPRQLRPHDAAVAVARATDSEGYIEIDDPAEAARILEEIDIRYSKAVAMANDAIVKTDNAFDNTRDIIRSVMENS